MSEAPAVARPPQEDAAAVSDRKPRPRWPLIAAGIAVALVLLGLGLYLFEEPEPALPAGAAGIMSTEDQTGAGSPTWAPGFLKMGFSFFVAFALGFAARKFLSVGLVVLGVLFGILFAGSHLGYMQVNWTAMGDDFDKFTSGLGEQFASIKAFITGSLPAAGLAGLGLFAGFKAG